MSPLPDARAHRISCRCTNTLTCTLGTWNSWKCSVRVIHAAVAVQLNSTRLVFSFFQRRGHPPGDSEPYQHLSSCDSKPHRDSGRKYVCMNVCVSVCGGGGVRGPVWMSYTINVVTVTLMECSYGIDIDPLSSVTRLWWMSQKLSDGLSSYHLPREDLSACN